MFLKIKQYIETFDRVEGFLDSINQSSFNMSETTIGYEGVNSTTEEAERERNAALVMLYDFLIILQVCIMMVSMGAGAEIEELKQQLRHPKALIIGMFCQLFLMPFLCFAISHMINLDDSTAIGVVVVAGCPGGAPANLFTAVSRGDLSLSVCLTVVSSILVLATMPLNKLMYVNSWYDETFVIPFVNIVIGIVATWVPALCGILIRYNSPKIAVKVTKIGGILAFVTLIVFAAVQNLVYPNFLAQPLDVWFMALTIPLLGWLIGFAVSAMFMVDISKRRSIAYSCEYVNAGLMLALISITYGGQREETRELLNYPMLYMATQLVLGILLMAIHALYHMIKEKRTICQKRYAKRVERMRPPGTFQEIPIGVGAPPLDHHVRRYQDILHKLYGYDEKKESGSKSTSDSPPSYSSLEPDRQSTYLEVDLNPTFAPTRKRASTVQANDIPISPSLQVCMNAEIDDNSETSPNAPQHGQANKGKRRRSSLPVLCETSNVIFTPEFIRNSDISENSSGYSGSSMEIRETDEEDIEIEKF